MFTLSIAALTLLSAASPAQRLPATVTPSRYQLAFTPELTSETFRGEETIVIRLSQPASAIVLNAAELTIDEATITQAGATQPAKVQLDADVERATFTVEKPLVPGDATVHVRYAGKLNGDLRGFYLAKTAKRKYAVTQFENTDARRAFPCFDEPAFKAVFEISLTVDRGDLALSNMKAVSDQPGPAESKHTVRFAPSPPMSTYLVAMAVGDFQCEGGSADGIPLRVCATPEGKGRTAFALSAMRFVLPFYDRYFGIKYPYGKLDLLAMPDFQAGAMENAGLIVARDMLTLVEGGTSYGIRKFAGQGVVAHEMAHQWFGDLVTMKWWDDIWLNEGFATWMSFKPTAAWQPGWNTAADAVQSSMGAMAADGLENTHPIHQEAESPAQIKELFDAISYNKTAAVLRMVEGYVGEETFRRGVDAYLRRYQYSNAAASDFWKEIAAASGKPADAVMSSFVMQPGVPMVAVSSKCVAGATEVTVSQRRYFANRARFAAGSKESWQIPVCVRSGRKEKCVLLSSQTQTANLPGCEPVYGNAGARGYYVTGYERENLASLAQAAPRLSAPERTLLLGDAMAGLTVGLLDAPDILTLSQGLRNETERPVVDLIAGGVFVIDEKVVSDAGRPAFRAWVQAVFGPVVEKLGDPAPKDSEERRALRADLWGIDGAVGRDPKLMKKARALVERALAGEAVDGTLLNAAIPIAAAQGDAALFDAFAKAQEAPRSPEDGVRYLTGLAAFEDPALVRRALEYGLTPKVRTQDALYLFATALGTRATRAPAWAFMREHWKAVVEKLPEAHHPYFVGSLSGFCDAPTRELTQKFLAAHPLPAAERSAKQALEAIDNCVQLRDAQSSKLDAWLTGSHG